MPDPSLMSVCAGVVECRACPRLVAWREQAAADKRAAYRDEDYWGRAVPGFGDPGAAVLVLGLAPAAHGANRTGRMFTGDRSGDWLYRAMWRARLASQPTSAHRVDGLTLRNAWVTSTVKCAPPDNKPTPAERDACRRWLVDEVAALANLRVVVCLGSFAYDAACSLAGVRPKPRFGHGVQADGTGPSGRVALLCSYHPSQQNTFTRRLTEPMLDAVFARAVQLAAVAPRTEPRRRPRSAG